MRESEAKNIILDNLWATFFGGDAINRFNIP